MTTSRPDLNPWHDAVLAAGDLIDSARYRGGDAARLDAALRILDALIGGVDPDPADLDVPALARRGMEP